MFSLFLYDLHFNLRLIPNFYPFILQTLYMQEHSSISERELHAPGRWQQFLWWLSTAEKELINTCVIDRNRYAIVGMTVLGTWLFATLAWTYFFSTVTSSWLMAIGMGLFMGGIILTIDRALIKGISRNHKRKAIPLIFRMVLALTIGLFMAQPALLFLFDKEIQVQVSIDNEQRKKEKRNSQDSVYFQQKKELADQKIQLETQLQNRYAEVSTARDRFIAETDGTGGSGKIGLKNIAQAKQREYLVLDADYRSLETQIKPQIRALDSMLLLIENNIRKEQASFELLLNDGFITRMEALNHLVSNSSAVAFRYYLLVAILMLIELMPVITKMLLPDGSYDEKVRLRESLEKELAKNNHKREFDLKEMHNQSAFEENKIFIQQFLNESTGERKEKMKEQLSAWRNTSHTSLDDTWKDMKHKMMIDQE